MLFTSQYKTSPDGKFMNMNVKKIGINIIILACVGSPGGGDIFCCKNMEAPIIIVKTGIP
jgi:hypothetical protein